jgi:chromosome segregation ATPase
MSDPTIEDLQATIEALNQRTADYDVQIASLNQQISSLTNQTVMLNLQVASLSDRDQWKSAADASAAEVQRLSGAIASYLTGTSDGQAIRAEYRKMMLTAQRDAASAELARLG